MHSSNYENRIQTFPIYVYSFHHFLPWFRFAGVLCVRSKKFTQKAAIVIVSFGLPNGRLCIWDFSYCLSVDLCECVCVSGKPYNFVNAGSAILAVAPFLSFALLPDFHLVCVGAFDLGEMIHFIFGFKKLLFFYTQCSKSWNGVWMDAERKYGRSE